MPALTDAPFAQLVRFLPALAHSVIVEAGRWGPLFGNVGLQQQFAAIFGGYDQIRLSRDRLRNFHYANQEQKCLEVMLWGFPNGMNGENDDQLFLQQIVKIAEAAQANANWPVYYRGLHGLGARLNTTKITKLAYFYHRVFEGSPALILDMKIINICADRRWDELHGLQHLAWPAVGNYVEYLHTLSRLAQNIGCRPDQLELFLFSFGESF